MRKLLIICGPTATGKTKLGINLARKLKGEIVSADSRQIYKGMNIGTGKEKVKDIPQWGLDLVEPNQEFSAAHFVEFAKKVIRDIWGRGKLPIIVGGTGFWIEALIHGVDSIGIPPDWQLRRELCHLSIKQLNSKLKKLDYSRWQKMNRSDRHNSRRLVRAIEIVKNSKLKVKSLRNNLKFGIDDLLMVGLRTDNYSLLYKRIDKRVEKRIKEGIVREIAKLLKKGYTWDLPAFSATGYRVWQDFFEAKKSLPETRERWQYDEHGLARRQMTFFKKNHKIKWFDIEKGNDVLPAHRRAGRPSFLTPQSASRGGAGFENKHTEIEKLVDQWYSKFKHGKN